MRRISSLCVNCSWLQREAPDEVKISFEEATDMCGKKIKGSLAIGMYGNLTAGEDPDTVVFQCAFDVEVIR